MDKSQSFTFEKEDSPVFLKKIPASKIIQTKQKKKLRTGLKTPKQKKLN